MRHDIARSERIPRPWSPPLSGRLRFVLWALTMYGVPLIIGQIALKVLLSTVPIKPLGFIELFAGKRAITHGMWDDGRLGIPYDIADDDLHENFLTSEGFAYAMLLALALEGGGGSWAGIVCSTWIGLNRNTSGRRRWKPLGHIQYASVRDGNLMAARLAALLQVLDALGSWWVIEQPAGSLLMAHPRMQHIISKGTVYKHMFRQQDFGAASAKPTWLWSNRNWIGRLSDEKLPDAATTSLTTLVNRGIKRDGTGSWFQKHRLRWIPGGPPLTYECELVSQGSQRCAGHPPWNPALVGFSTVKVFIVAVRRSSSRSTIRLISVLLSPLYTDDLMAVSRPTSRPCRSRLTSSLEVRTLKMLCCSAPL